MRPVPIHLPGVVPQGTACGQLVHTTTRMTRLGEMATCKRCVAIWEKRQPKAPALVHFAGAAPGSARCGFQGRPRVVQREGDVTCPRCLDAFKGPKRSWE